jgi:PAS domain S-box-containing protein
MGALALAALLGNWFSLPASFGVDFLFGSIAVMLALAWLGTGAGLLAALVGGAYTWLLWGHPYALLTFLAEVAAVGWHRDRARRRGLAPPPLAVSAALYWLLLGVPLALLAHRFALGLSWTATLLIAVKQAENGILNAALADLVLVAGVLLTRRKSSLPLAQVLFGVLLAALLVPLLLLNAWENRDLKDRLEAAQADRLRLFGELAVHQLVALPPGRGADPAVVEAQLQVMRSVLAEHLPASCAPQLRLERGLAPVPETQVPAAWSPLTWVFGRQARPGQVIPTAAPGLSLILPSGRYSSRLALWHAALYRMAIPVHAIPALEAAFPPDPAGTPPQGVSLVMELHAAPLIDQLQWATVRLLVLLLAVALLGLLVAHRLSRRIARPLRALADDSRALPAAIREDRPWPAPVPGLLAETGDLADAVAEMARSLAANFRALLESERRFRNLFETMAEGVIYRDDQGTITDANPAALRLLGQSPERLLGTGIADLPWQVLREDGSPLPAAEHPAMVALRTGQDPGAAVMGVINPLTGDTRWLLVHARPEVRPGESRPFRVFTSFADITRLQQTERRLRAIIEASPHGIVEADPLTRRLLWCSGSMLHLFGYGPAQWQGLRVDDMHPVESLPQVAAEFARMAQGDLATALELPCRRRDGGTFYCKVSPGLMRLGQASTLVAFFTDVTAERAARLALELSQESLLKAQEIARLGSWEFDIVHDRVSWSPEAFRIFEQDPQCFEPCYEGMLTSIHPEDRALLDRVYRESVAKRIPYELEHRLLTPDGRVKWVYERSETDYAADGTPLRSRGTVQDITEQRAATQRQQALEAALTRYNLQLEEFADLISLPLPPAEQVSSLLWLGCRRSGVGAAVLVMMDEERGQRVLFAANDETGNGFTPEISRALVVETLTHLGSPCVLGSERLPAAALSAGLRACVAMAFTCPRPDGQADTLILSLWGPEPSLDLDGPGRQIIRLIAQRVASIRYQEQVQHDLVQAKGRETIGHLASGIAHDFNNLLGVIDANVYYLEARLGDLAPADPQLRQVMEETQSALGQAKVVTSGMLSLSRAGGVPLESVDLAPTVAELERILRQVLPAAIDLRVAVAPGTLAWSNGAFLQSALLNLAFNARDAMPDGGVLSIDAQPIRWDGHPPLAVGAVASMDCIALRVTDTGSGIAPSLLARIFDPLFSTKARQRGHGLGLFMVQEFVTRSGAGLTVESQPGHGTCFTLLLPREAPAVGIAEGSGASRSLPVGPPAPAASADGTAPAPLSGLRVLVVEDDPRVREAVGRLLALDGARLGQAEHGQACLELLERDAAFDLVLSDIAMPILDGIHLQQRLAQERPGLPVILMTGQKDALSALDELSERPTVLRKPLDPAVLRGAILAKTGVRPRSGTVVAG